MIGRNLPCVLSSLVFFLALLLVLGGSPVSAASTPLTNGHPIFVKIPPIEEELTVIAGDDGFNISVPAGATRLVVEFVTEPSADVELAVEFGQDVGTDGIGNDLADFRTRPNPRGVARIEIDKVLSHPRLQAGTYFIGFFFVRPGGDIEGRLTATITGGPIEPVRTLAESTFESDLEGWTRNDTPSSLPGTSVGDPQASIQFVASGGNPDGFARIRHITGSAEEWFVAPPEFLTDYLSLNEARFVFDMARITGLTINNFTVELRIFGEEGAWKWSGPSAPEVNGGWATFSATIRRDMWVPFEGTAAQFEEIFSNPRRLEVRATFNRFAGNIGLDNFKLLARGEMPIPVVLPVTSSFSAGVDGWDRNYPAPEKIEEATVGDVDSMIVWNEFEGNPEGFVRIVESGGGAPDAFVVSDLYLGDWTQLNSPRIEFDYRHSSVSGAVRPVVIRMIGTEAVFEWTGALPGDVWSRQVANVTPGEWVQVAGDASFEETLAYVLRLEITADQAQGPELNSVDNFSLLTVDTPPVPQSLNVAPATLTFSGVATGPNPDPETIDITASAGELRWQASIEGVHADRISLSATSGDTPSEVTVRIDTEGLAAGVREAARITFTAVGATVEPFVLPVNLALGAQPNPTPEIFSGGIVNSASFQPEFAGGCLVTIFGRFLGGPPEGVIATFIGRNDDTLPTNVNGVRVLISSVDGLRIAEAPIIYLGDSQINFQMPFEVSGFALVRVAVDNNGARSESQTLQITRAAPGIFTFDGTQAIAVNADGTVNGPDNPVPRNSVVTLYLTGQGPVAPQIPTGKAAPANPLVLAPLETRVLVGGHDAEVQFFGLAPGLVGVLQLNLSPSFFTPTGGQSVIVNVGGHESNTAIIYVR